MFPDVLERKVKHRFDEGDDVSAMLTGEFYTKKDLFPGFGRPFGFYAEILLSCFELLRNKQSQHMYYFSFVPFRATKQTCHKMFLDLTGLNGPLNPKMLQELL